MLTQPIRLSRPALLRVRQWQPARFARRTFITPTVPRPADLVQDLYLREIKNYKVPEVKASDSDGHVQKFSISKAPTSPEESDIASDLKAYETQTVEVEGAVAGEGNTAVQEEDWFVEEEDNAAPAAH